MTSIWAFCLQTLTVSLAALLLLLIKGLLLDKLSPRWQYGIWSLLALRCLLPASIRRNVILSIGLWLETAKAVAESTLNSAYSAVFAPISLNHVFPAVPGAPRSLTDWLLVIYAAGAAALGLYYLCAYFALRLRLRRGQVSTPAVTGAMARACEKYGLKPCRIVAVPGLESAFVCGILKPVLAVPAESEVDDKVILHELLHLKHRDILQSVFWAALRCLHWCNPLMHYVFDRIGNDMESLCDQRVLERLEGEERREYGRILLNMASRRYARTPGTGSISNGGRNISRRIAAIVRFKKYPRGMALVSACIGLVLASPLLIGTVTASYKADAYCPESPTEQVAAMALARVQRCTTVAGAIDTYAKGLVYENGIYVAIATPISSHETLLEQMPQDWYLDNGPGLEYLDPFAQSYSIFDLVQNTDGSYDAYLAFSVSDFEGAAEEDWPKDNNGAAIVAGSLIVPLRITREDGFWTVEERAERIRSYLRYDQLEFYGDDMPWLAEQTVRCETGTVTLRHRGQYQVDNTVITNDLFGWTGFDTSIKHDAEFSSGHIDCDVIYEFDESCGIRPRESAAIYVWYFETPEEFAKGEAGTETPDETGNCSGSYYDCHFAMKSLAGGWDGQLWAGVNLRSGGTLSLEELPTVPAGYIVQIVLDGEVVEELRIEGGTS